MLQRWMGIFKAAVTVSTSPTYKMVVASSEADICLGHPITPSSGRSLDSREVERVEERSSSTISSAAGRKTSSACITWTLRLGGAESLGNMSLEEFNPDFGVMRRIVDLEISQRSTRLMPFNGSHYPFSCQKWPEIKTIGTLPTPVEFQNPRRLHLRKTVGEIARV
jgi:hypothetical protein